MTLKRTSLLLVLLALLAGCGALRPGFETPTVTVRSFRAIPSDGAVPNFEIGLSVVNPNSASLRLDGIAYTISLQGNELIEGVASDLPVIPGYGEGDVTLTASANLFAAIGLITNLMRSGTDSVDYAFEARLDLAGLAPTIRVRDAGKVSLRPGQQN